MSRHGYVDDYCDPLEHGRWRGQVRSAMRGKRGQKFLREILAALDAMPVKELHPSVLATKEGECCAMGAALLARVERGETTIEKAVELDPDDPQSVAAFVDVAEPLVREIAYYNDEVFPGWSEAGYLSREPGTDPARRWKAMRKWIASKIRDEAQ